MGSAHSVTCGDCGARSKVQHHAEIENSMKPYRCKGSFRFDAPARCAKRRSTSLEIDAYGHFLCYD